MTTIYKTKSGTLYFVNSKGSYKLGKNGEKIPIDNDAEYLPPEQNNPNCPGGVLRYGINGKQYGSSKVIGRDPPFTTRLKKPNSIDDKVVSWFNEDMLKDRLKDEGVD